MIDVVVLLGSTAVGKSRIAHELVDKFPFEIVSCDSMQVYQGMDIGTGKPSLEERKRYHYHMIDVVQMNHRYSAGEYAKDTQKVIEVIAQRNKIPLVVGGTGLYLDSLIYGISSMPKADLTLREKLRKEAAVMEGTSILHERLSKIDPQSAERIHLNDLKRIIRALEVYYLTGKPISEIQMSRERTQKYNHLLLGLFRERFELYERIEVRVDKMFEEGLVEEVVGLLGRGFGAELPAFQALGYKEVVEYLKGSYSLEEIKERVKKNTRNFAKRQMTYFKKNKEIRWFKLDDERDKIFKELKKLLL